MNKKKIAAWAVAVACTSQLLAGCEVKTDTPVLGTLFGLESDQVFQIDGTICTVPEVKLVLMDKTNQYKKDLGQDVTSDQQIGDTTLGDYIKEETKKEISVVYTIAALADENEVSLTDEEKNSVKEAAKNYFKSLSTEELTYTEATEETVISLYTNYYLANKVYNTITENVDIEISDEEARVMKMQYIYIDTSKTEVAKAKETLEEVIGLVNGGYQSFSREAKQYSDKELTEAVVKKNEASKAYEQAAFELSDGKMSSIITQDDGLYLVYCEESYLKDETAQNKKEIISNNRKAYFSEVYEKYTKDVSKDFNTKAWEGVKSMTEASTTESVLFSELDLQ